MELALNQQVAGSSPARRTSIYKGFRVLLRFAFEYVPHKSHGTRILC